MSGFFTHSTALVCCLAVGSLAILLGRPQRKLELTPDDETKLHGVTILITGATSGIGLGLTRVLYKQLGASIIVIGRSESKLQQLQEELPLIRTFQADLNNLESVKQACDLILTQVDAIDMIVNNAGIHALFSLFSTKTVPVKPNKQMDEVFVVNYLSHNLLFEKLKPLLQNSTSPKVVQISSNFHWAVDGTDLMATPDHDPVASVGSHGYCAFRTQRSYANSKLAQIYQARAWQKEYPDWSFTSICPGWVGTGIGGGGLFGWILSKLAFPPEGWGIASAVHAILNDSNEKGDFYINTQVFRAAHWLIPVESPAWFYKLAVRDAMVGTLAYTILFGQRFFGEVSPMRSSPESYNEDRALALSEWARDALSSYL